MVADLEQANSDLADWLVGELCPHSHAWGKFHHICMPVNYPTGESIGVYFARLDEDDYRVTDGSDGYERAIWAGCGIEFCAMAADVARRFGVCYVESNYSFTLSGLRKSQLAAAVSHIAGAVFFMSHRLATDFNEQAREKV